MRSARILQLLLRAAESATSLPNCSRIEGSRVKM
jgi:hypothetical protein